MRLLFKVGEGKNNQLRLSKFHLSVIDDLYENRDETELSFELDEKYERLRDFKSIPEVADSGRIAKTGFALTSFRDFIGLII